MTTAITFPSVKEIEVLSKLTITITSPDTKAEAEKQLARIRLATKNLKLDVTAAKKPYKDAIDLIDQAAKPWATSLLDQDQAFERALIAYNNKVRAAVAASNVKVLDKYETKVATKEAEAIANNKPVPLVLPPSLKAEPPKTSHTDEATITTVKRKAWRLAGGSARVPEDMTADEAHAYRIPLEYFKLDTSKIGKVVRAGGAIPGIEVYEEESLSVKAR